MFGSQHNTRTQNAVILSKIAKFLRFDSRVYTLDIDFGKPFWQPLTQKPLFAILNLVNGSFFSLSRTFLPIMVSFVVSAGTPIYVLWLGLYLLVERLFTHILFYFHPLYFIPLFRSIEKQGYAKLLLVDPISHSTRSSGQIISKLSRGSTAYLQFSDTIVFAFTPLIMSSISVLVVIGFFNIWFALLFLVVACAATYGNYFMFKWRSQTINKVRHELEDTAKARAIESMQQVTFLRSIFATEQSISKTDNAYNQFMIAEMTGWRFGGYIITTTIIIGYIFTCLFLYYLIISGVDKIIAVGISYTVLSFFLKLYEVGKMVDKFTQNIDDIKDMFTFIDTYGQSTYPTIAHKTNTTDTML